jgi:thioredoxin-related protein
MHLEVNHAQAGHDFTDREGGGAIAKLRPGQKVTLKIRRRGETRTVDITPRAVEPAQRFLKEEILMRRKTTLLALAVSLCTLAAQAGGPSTKLPPAGYDKTRDPAADLAAAIPQAQRENKRILLEVGGEWCVYCRLINKVIHEDERLMKMLDDGFIVVKVNFSDDVKNAAFLSRYPAIPSYPHLFVLETDGTFLLSQTPDDFMDKDRYVPDKILGFLQQWAPKKKA